MKADQNLIDYIEAEEEGKSATGVMGPFLKHTYKKHVGVRNNTQLVCI